MSAIPVSGNLAAPRVGVSLLIVSSSPDLRRDLASRLQSERWSLSEARSGAEALEKLDAERMAAILLDPGLPDLRVDDFKNLVQSQHPEVACIPVNPDTGQPMVVSSSPNSICFEVVRQIERGMPFPASQTPVWNTEDEERQSEGLPGFVGNSPSVRKMFSLVRLVAQRDTTVLITGESGTGKDVVAQAVHELSPRRQRPFVVINCAAIPEALLEAELFGYVKGAFTGAVQSRIGRIHAAQGGSLFLDEIGDLPLGLQSKLLRFLEQGEVQRLGSADTFRVDVRVIVATNASLRRLVQERNFREDLFYRLSIFPIELAPLRERMDDLNLLTQFFLAKYCAHDVALSAEAVTLLQQHNWPGNVRELRNVIERASILAGRDREIRREHILL
jgi:DNA-binding NtrC family response regulator